MHKPPPAGWPQLSPALFYRRPAEAIDWLCQAFGFDLVLKVEGEPGEIVHAEIAYGQALVMVGTDAASGQDDPARPWKRRHASPLSVDGRITQSACLFVDDADAHCTHARAHGAVVFEEPATHDYGGDYWSDRSYGAFDCEGHAWWFSTRLREGPPR
jgi:uncharacterized glyoxalase superfamily protein PhnB